MNLNNIRKEPVFVAAAGGCLGALLRLLLYRFGFDGKGILSASHPLHLACLALAALMITWLAIQARKVPERHREFPLLRLAAGFLGGCFLLLHAAEIFGKMIGLLDIFRFLLTVPAAVAMVLCLLPQGSRFAAPCHGLICASCAVDMLSRYRNWSGNPQLPDYVFHVLAGVTLCLCTYQTLALHTGLGSPKLRKFWGLLALFLCILCLSGPEPRAFYLSGGFWALRCLLTPSPPEPETAPEENDNVSA